MKPAKAGNATTVSKSVFKPKALEYFRQVEKTGSPLIITDHGTPVLKIVPYDDDPRASLEALRKSVVRYDGPDDPVGEDDWDAAQ